MYNNVVLVAKMTTEMCPRVARVPLCAHRMRELGVCRVLVYKLIRRICPARSIGQVGRCCISKRKVGRRKLQCLPVPASAPTHSAQPPGRKFHRHNIISPSNLDPPLNVVTLSELTHKFDAIGVAIRWWPSVKLSRCRPAGLRRKP